MDFFIFHIATQLLRVPLEIVFVWLFFLQLRMCYTYFHSYGLICVYLQRSLIRWENVIEKMATKINRFCTAHISAEQKTFCINLLSFVFCSFHFFIAFLLLVWGSYPTHTVGLLQVYCTWKALTLLTESKKTIYLFFAYFISEYKEWKDVCKGRNNHILSSYKKLWQCQNHLQQIETNRIMNFINSIL